MLGDAYGAKLRLTGSCFLLVEGHRCCRTENQQGRDVEGNGWLQYINANENEAELGRCWMYYTAGLRSDLLSCVPDHGCQVANWWGSGKQDQSAASPPATTLQSRYPQNLHKKYMKCQRYTCSRGSFYFPLSAFWAALEWNQTNFKIIPSFW